MPEQPVFLVAHPAHPSAGIERLSVSLMRAEDGLCLTYRVDGLIETLRLPTREPGGRRDQLWQHTCFELFVRDTASDQYFEFNFSPGGDWAAYAFDHYRQGGRNLNCTPPKIETIQTDARLTVSVSQLEWPPEIVTEPRQFGPTAILETKSGSRSYWALDHLGEAPDFHRSETFQLSLD
ncbi:MAG: DOMON-like domain-containing protein [Hyphomonadaceae bacterium]|nr:DOMON-like domain-containing protein [Hyphomonadaceae bacterium]